MGISLWKLHASQMRNLLTYFRICIRSAAAFGFSNCTVHKCCIHKKNVALPRLDNKQPANLACKNCEASAAAAQIMECSCGGMHFVIIETQSSSLTCTRSLSLSSPGRSVSLARSRAISLFGAVNNFKVCVPTRKIGQQCCCR